MPPPKPPPFSTPGTLRLASLFPGSLRRGSLRVLRLDEEGPRFVPLRTLRATDVEVRVSTGAGLPATGLTWALSGRGLALSLILGN